MGNDSIKARFSTLAAAALAVVVVGSAAAPSDAEAGRFDNLLAPEEACPGQSDSTSPVGAQTATMLCMHRYARAKAGRPAIKNSRKLRRSARLKAKDIVRCHQFSHEACGRNAFFWFSRVGYMKGSFGVGENIAYGTRSLGSPRARMKGWLYSSGHRRALLSRAFREIGIALVDGRYLGRRDTGVWVAHLGYRR